MGRIRTLPDQLINQIAAGEVVERPASAVKELVENALDAEAASITIKIEEGGRKLIEVSDDGVGMDPDDTLASLDRHATSKLGRESSLESIETLGFRGEAIPSIAAVSRFTMTSSSGGPGTRVKVNGGRILGSSPVAHPRGTTVAVADLFYNLPARRAFLRAPSTELGHIVEIFLSFALSRPQLKLRLIHGNRRLFDLPVCKDRQSRLSQIEGPDAARGASLIDEKVGDVALEGHILSSEERGVRRTGRKLVVNGRVVRDRLLSRAVSKSLEEFLPSRSIAACFLSIRLPAAQVDINVHPAKAEVRFANPRAIHDMVFESIGKALGRYRPPREGPRPSAAWMASDSGSSNVSPAAGGHMEGVVQAASAFMERDRKSSPPAGYRYFQKFDEAPSISEPTPSGVPEVLGHYRSGYIIAADEEGLLLVDQHAAHERILFEQIIAAASGATPEMQPLLFARTVDLPSVLKGQAGEVCENLKTVGFDVEPFGEGTVVVRGVPAALADAEAGKLVEEILAREGVQSDAAAGIEERRRRILATAACHAAVKVPAHLTREKLTYIVQRLVECHTPLKCPHGRPTLLRWDHRSLERRFGRP